MPVARPWDWNKEVNLPLPSREEFLAGRHRTFGITNPEPIRDAFKEYMVRTLADPYSVAAEFGRPVGPRLWPWKKDRLAVWTFQRSGQTNTLYRERYQILIGGEHEDYYDTNFLIYNDVVVLDHQGNPWIYGYPREVFPPTDFHTATLLGRLHKPRNGILIIGGLGYPEEREVGRTPVYYLNLDEMSFHPWVTTGDSPGWIYKHTAVLLPGGNLLIAGGQILNADGEFHPNLHRYELRISTQSWTRAS